MSLQAGDTLGAYEILAPIGAGGMGEVYRARDVKLKRDVALKVLPDAFARDPERMARFQREAEVLASLNHPNIAAIYGVEERALVMELVEGEALEGPLPLETALHYAKQIAEALEAAHEKGITHRDLKPANIMITPAGVVKVLDFGLAAVAQVPGSGGDAMSSPTLTIHATQAGMIMGTAAYMSPEQASGKPVDKRSDIWSFGVVLWEMLTGQRLFEGETISHTLAHVLTAAIDLNRIPVTTPPAIRELLARCLDRDVRTRLQAIGEARVTIQRWLANPSAVTEAPGPQSAPSEARSTSRLPWAVAALFAVLAGVVTFLYFRKPAPAEHTLGYTIAPPGSVHSFAVSPDGRLVVMAAIAAGNGKRQLWLRPMDALQWQPMPSTDDARYPFWSPDSRYIAFFAEGKLRKVAASGGPSQPVCDAVDGRGGSWNRDGVIVFSPSASPDANIQRVPAAGGVPSDVTKTRTRYLFPVFLPDGRHFLYETAGVSQEPNGIHFASLDGKENRRVLADVSSAVFAPASGGDGAGHLLFFRENNLMALPFDPVKGQASGDVFPVAEAVSLANGNNYAPMTVSGNGVLLYWTGGTGGIGGGTYQLVLYDRGGKVLEPVGPLGNVLQPSISPDEKMIAFSRAGAGGNRDIWLHDLVRGNERRLTTDVSTNVVPFWSPQTGDRIVFVSSRVGHPNDLYLRASSGAGQDQSLLSTPNGKIVDQWSRDGRFIVYTENDPKNKWDLWYLPMGDSSTSSGSAADRKPVPFLHSGFNELQGQLSPDSRWMAYMSDVSGQREVYVQPFPSADNEIRISTAGGEQPRWRGDGKELFYLGADGKITSVAITASAGPKPSFNAGAPAPLFDAHIASGNTNSYFNYDVTADGRRFVIATNGATTSPTGAAPPPLIVRVNWNAASKK
ncbi:MAG TPA: protein kinase [Bryobacteraceae bacterium]|nr:protein kinase [Bryobacteraceae bacterium]